MTEPVSPAINQLIVGQPAPLSANGSPWSPNNTMWLDPPKEAEGLNFSRFLHSVRRSWLWGCLIGAALAPIAAGVLYFVIPSRHEAEALVRVNMVESDPLPNPMGRVMPNQQEFETFRETQVEMIKSPYVLQRVLSEDSINSLSMIKKEGMGALAMLQRKLSVTANPKGQLIRVALTGSDAEQIKTIVDMVVTKYLAEQSAGEREVRVKALDTLRAQKRINDVKITEEHRKIYAIAEDVGTEDSAMVEMKKEVASEELRSIIRSKETLEKETQELSLEYYVLQNKLRTKPAKPDPMMIEDELETDPQYMELVGQLTEMEQQMAQAGGGRPGSAMNSRIEGQMAMLRQAVEKRRKLIEPRARARVLRSYDDNMKLQARLNEVQAASQVAQKRLEMLAKELDDKKKELRELTGFSAELLAKTEEVEQMEKMNAEIASEISRLELAQNRETRVAKVQDATIPNEFQNLLRLVGIGLASVLTFGMALVGAALTDYFKNYLSAPGELERETSVPVLGTIPALEAKAKNREVLMANSVDSIRAAITRGDRATEINAVLVSSAGPKEGKSTVASQLAVSLARSGRRTVLVDADIRRPQLHLMFGLPGDRGVCDVLRGEAVADQLSQATPAENLWVLPAGRYDPVTLRGLNGPAIGAMIDNLRAKFDFVVIDSAPILSSPEPLVFGQYVSGVVISARRDFSCITKIDDATRRLQSVGIRVLGSVILGGRAEARPDRVALPAK